jgi:hypothetical protein
MNRNRKCRAVSAVLTVILALASAASAEWKEKVLYSFQGGANDGSVPAGGVVFDSQGNLYGVLQDYGPGSCAPIGNQCGAVFQLAPPAQKGGAWTETLIYKFQGKGANDGESPNGGLIIDSQGSLYGVTAYGGTGDCVLLGVKAGCGTVYEISPPKQKGGAWTETILYSFPTANQGYLPNGNLVFDGAGNLYGATGFGGGKGTTCDPFYQYCGTIFKLRPPRTKGGKWAERVLHSFAAGTDGANPNGGLVLDSSGAVYGTTSSGGNQGCKYQGTLGCGIVFKLNPPVGKGRAWSEKLIYVFKDGNDGATPNGSLIFDVNGRLCGTAGGGVGQSGVAFRLAESSGHWKETVLYSFTGRNDGSDAGTGLIFDSAGYLYGTALGGQTNEGLLFRLKPPAQGNLWSFSVLYNFTSAPDGNHPIGTLVLSKAHILFGTAGGGTANEGSVFSVWP